MALSTAVGDAAGDDMVIAELHRRHTDGWSGSQAAGGPVGTGIAPEPVDDGWSAPFHPDDGWGSTSNRRPDATGAGGWLELPPVDPRAAIIAEETSRVGSRMADFFVLDHQSLTRRYVRIRWYTKLWRAGQCSLLKFDLREPAHERLDGEELGRMLLMLEEKVKHMWDPDETGHPSGILHG